MSCASKSLQNRGKTTLDLSMLEKYRCFVITNFWGLTKLLEVFGIQFTIGVINYEC